MSWEGKVSLSGFLDLFIIPLVRQRSLLFNFSFYYRPGRNFGFRGWRSQLS